MTLQQEFEEAANLTYDLELARQAGGQPGMIALLMAVLRVVKGAW